MKVKHGYFNGINDEYKTINNLICLYDFDNTYNNFITMTNHLQPEFVRGAVRRSHDTISAEKITALHCDIVDIGLVFKGYKPMCYVEDDDMPDFFNQLGLQIITFKQQYGKKTRREHIIYKDVLLKDRATFLANHIQQSTEDKEHHYIMGDYLGYPKEDVDYFVYR